MLLFGVRSSRRGSCLHDLRGKVRSRVLTLRCRLSKVARVVQAREIFFFIADAGGTHDGGPRTSGVGGRLPPLAPLQLVCPDAILFPFYLLTAFSPLARPFILAGLHVPVVLVCWSLLSKFTGMVKSPHNLPPRATSHAPRPFEALVQFAGDLERAPSLLIFSAPALLLLSVR